MNQASRLDPYIPRIRVMATSGRALSFIFANIIPIAVCAAVPLLTSQAIWFACYFLIGGFWDEIVSRVANTLPAVFFIVALCRLALLGSEEASPRFIGPWTRRHWHVARIQFVILMILIPVQDLFVPLVIETETYIGYFGFGIYLVGFFVCVAVTLRMALAQPGQAVDAPVTIQRAWDLSREQGLRLLLSVHLAALPFILGSDAIDIIFEGTTGLSREWPDGDRVAAFDWRLVPLSFAHAVMAFLNIAAKFLVLSFAFRTVSGWRSRQQRVLERFD